MNPLSTPSIPEYAAFLVGRGKPDRALALNESIKDDPKRQLDYFHIKGRALLGLGRLAEAVTALEAGNRLYDSDTGLLGDLGRCYALLGRTAEAIAVLRASLKLNPDQPVIKELLDQLSKK